MIMISTRQMTNESLKKRQTEIQGGNGASHVILMGDCLVCRHRFRFFETESLWFYMSIVKGFLVFLNLFSQLIHNRIITSLVLRIGEPCRTQLLVCSSSYKYLPPLLRVSVQPGRQGQEQGQVSRLSYRRIRPLHTVAGIE